MWGRGIKRIGIGVAGVHDLGSLEEKRLDLVVENWDSLFRVRYG